MVRNVYFQKLSQNLLEMLDDKEYYDITIEVGNDPYVKVFRAHIVILSYRSPHLRRILSTNKKKNDGALTHIKLPNILPDIFQIILRYIYGGKLILKEYDISDIVKILVAANELGLQELIPNIQYYLIESKENWVEQNFNLIFRTCFENNSFSELQNFCKELMSKQPEKIFNSSGYVSIPEEALIFLIQQDNLQMSKIQVWEHVLKWGIAKNPRLSSDPSSYSNDDFNALRDTLQQCITYFKFTELTSREFLNKVYPYKKVIPEDLQDNLLKYFLDYDNKTSKKLEEKQTVKEISVKRIDSKIITIQHTKIISKWIDKIGIADNLENSYEFKLIFRGSRDGFTAQKFHEICDYQSHTVTIIKVKGSNEILGGYNPIEWKNSFFGSFGTTKDSFIFSFVNKNSIENCHISRVEDEKFAINYWNYYGPSFGHNDLIMYGGYFGEISFNNETSRCKKVSYENQIRGTGEFSIEDYEVFQIHK